MALRRLVGSGENAIFEYLEESGQPKDTVDTLLTTMEVFRNAVIVRRDLDPQLKKSLKDVLLAMDSTPEGREALAGFDSSNRFTEFEPSKEVALEGIRELAQFLEKEIIQR